MKNTKVATRYMIPIRLWSVVRIQSIQRLLLRGAVTSLAITWGTSLAAYWVVDIRLSFSLEISVARQRLAQLGHLRVGRIDRVLLCAHPFEVLRGADDPDPRQHRVVLAAAQLGAVADVRGARTRSLEPCVGRVAGNRVDLAAERGDP